MKTKVAILLSSVRPDRLADRVNKCVNQFVSTDKFVIDVIDPKIEKLPMLDTPYHFYPNKDLIPDYLKQLYKRIDEANCFLIVTAEYNCTIPPALSNMLDYFPPSIFKLKPTGIIAYSMGSGSFYSANHISWMLTKMGCLILPMMVNIRQVMKVIDDNGKCNDENINKNIQLVMEQLEYVTTALVNHGKNHKAPAVNELFN